MFKSSIPWTISGSSACFTNSIHKLLSNGILLNKKKGYKDVLVPLHYYQHIYPLLKRHTALPSWYRELVNLVNLLKHNQQNYHILYQLNMLDQCL